MTGLTVSPVSVVSLLLSCILTCNREVVNILYINKKRYLREGFKKINSIFSDICRIGGGGVCPKVNFNLFLNPDIKGLEGGGSRSMFEFQR